MNLEEERFKTHIRGFSYLVQIQDQSLQSIIQSCINDKKFKRSSSFTQKFNKHFLF